VQQPVTHRVPRQLDAEVAVAVETQRENVDAHRQIHFRCLAGRLPCRSP
jgi:hypothetical protein